MRINVYEEPSLQVIYTFWNVDSYYVQAVPVTPTWLVVNFKDGSRASVIVPGDSENFHFDIKEIRNADKSVAQEIRS